MTINWKSVPFTELSPIEIYDMLSLRAEVFVVEQAQAYQDADYRDLQCYHVLGYDGDTLVAHCRVFPLGGYFEDGCIGRVVVKPSHRQYGLGHILVDKAIETHNEINGKKASITISAQHRLKKFYEAHGFVKSSTSYQEDNIPHIHMTRKGVED